MDNLPHSIEAEQALLGACLVSSRAFEDVADKLAPGDFYHPAHGRVWEAMAEAVNAGRKADLPVVSAVLKTDTLLSSLGGVPYLAQLAAAVITTGNAAAYSDQIKDAANRRILILAARELIDRAGNGDARAEALAAEHAATLDPILTGGSRREIRHVSDCLDEAIRDWQEATRQGGPTGIMTGLHALDKLLRGLKPDRLGVVAGRPAMGKTAFSLSILINAARAGHKVGMWSLEMGGSDLAQRILCAEAGISAEDADMGRLKHHDFEAMLAVRRDFARLGIHIDDNESLTPSALRARVLQHKRRFGLDLVLVDYLGLMDPDMRTGNRVQDVQEITRALKRLTKEAGLPVIILSQLNRGVEARENKRPTLADLRDSGSIEQDADFVAFLYREEYYLAREEPQDPAKWPGWKTKLEACRGKAEIIVAKQRRGPVDTAVVRFDGPRTRFENLT
jgi:replicative DNA helicase